MLVSLLNLLPSTKAASIVGIVSINWIELLLLYRNGSGLINTIPSIAIVLLTYQLPYLTSAATSCNTNDQFQLELIEQYDYNNLVDAIDVLSVEYNS